MNKNSFARKRQVEKERAEWALKCHDEWSYLALKEVLNRKVKRNMKLMYAGLAAMFTYNFLPLMEAWFQ